jgi:hypothetical protein
MATAGPSTLTPCPKFFERLARAGVAIIGLHDLRHTHGSLLIEEGVPVKVVSERLGHARIAFTIETYQHVLPGTQADAARTYQQLTTPVPPGLARPLERRRNSRRNTGVNRWTPPSTTKAQVAGPGPLHVTWWRGQD